MTTGGEAAAMANSKSKSMMAPLRVCVDRMDPEQITGRVYSQYLTEPVAFKDITDFLMQMEDVFDKLDFPRAFQRKRTFSTAEPELPAPATKKLEPEQAADQAPKYMEAAFVDSTKGEVMTFLVWVATRQNSSWQGWIDWLDGSPRVDYDSALELIRLIDNSRHLL